MADLKQKGLLPEEGQEFRQICSDDGQNVRVGASLPRLPIQKPVCKRTIQTDICCWKTVTVLFQLSIVNWPLYCFFPSTYYSQQCNFFS